EAGDEEEGGEQAAADEVGSATQRGNAGGGRGDGNGGQGGLRGRGWWVQRVRRAGWAVATHAGSLYISIISIVWSDTCAMPSRSISSAPSSPPPNRAAFPPRAASCAARSRWSARRWPISSCSSASACSTAAPATRN